jgi:hypothetical protein
MLELVLANVGNPDFRQNPNKNLNGIENKLVKVEDLQDASSISCKYIEDNDLGSGNWSGGFVYNTEGIQVAYISYNGRIWESGEYMLKDSKNHYKKLTKK